MTKRRNDREVDAAESWLRKNDPKYAQTSRSWRPARTDALEHQSGRNKMHSTLQDLKHLPNNDPLLIPGAHGIPRVVGSGNYRKLRASGDGDEHQMGDFADEQGEQT